MPPSDYTIATLLSRAATRLGVDGRTEAELLLTHALARPRAWLFAHADDPVADGDAEAFERLVQRRERGEPIAQILGHAGFWSLDLRITPDVLIPRPETELLVERALALLPIDRALRVADLGTGSGAIALAIASERPLAKVAAVDASAAALEVAQANVQALNLSARVRCVQGDWFAPLADERFDLIASNPPYVAQDDPHLREGDLRFEPMLALASGNDGLDAIRRIVRAATAHLHAGGWLLLEHGWQQGSAVRAILAESGFEDIVTEHDLEHRERMSRGRVRG
ncbi:MAG: peptide chain release factor N(5)-glutamine methyltransferase [Proteobacteria bacterium]|nr:peptide chain release factor N(5)-glutamine methyltransferase [Pseudomonadota bacterium]